MIKEASNLILLAGEYVFCCRFGGWSRKKEWMIQVRLLTSCFFVFLSLPHLLSPCHVTTTTATSGVSAASSQNATDDVTWRLWRLCYVISGSPEGHRAGQRVGSISDYDPMNDQWGSVVQQPYSSGQQFTETVAAPGGPGYQQQPQQQFRQPGG